MPRFEKNYTYDIKHTYGKVGNMKGGQAFSCASTINAPMPGAGQ